MSSSKILFVDDRWKEEQWKESFDGWLPDSVEAVYEEYGYKALERLSQHPNVKLVFLDLQFKDQPEQGEQILYKIKERYPDLKVIILTSINDIQLALKVVHEEKLAYYYFFKDSLDRDQVQKTIENAIESYDLRAEAIRKTDAGTIVGDSPEIKGVLRLVERASNVNFPVLVTGESGTGKELVARAIHQNSLRRRHPFKAVNCGAISEGLIESELFGHVRGAFTNALKDKRGRFELADRGTLFLDEITDLKLDMQVRLLRVLQMGEIERVGSETTKKIDVRVISATNEKVEDRVKQGLFREDLFHRLDVIPIAVPPLRSRKQDIPLLVGHILQNLNNELDRAVDLADDALALLMDYDWPGNVRELENKLKQAVTLSDSETLGRSDFPALFSRPERTIGDKASAADWIERVMRGNAMWDDVRTEFAAASDTRRQIVEGVILALRHNLGHRPSGDEIAKLFGINRNHLNQLLATFGLQLKDY